MLHRRRARDRRRQRLVIVGAKVEDPGARRQRTEGLYNVDRCLDLHKSQDNPFVQHCYDTCIGAVGGAKAHELLHTHYHSRRRIQDEDVTLNAASAAQKVPVTVCVGTSCFLRGSQDLLRDLLQEVKDRGVQERVDLRATFCHERCDRGPMVTIAGRFIEHCTPALARQALAAALAATAAPCSTAPGVGAGGVAAE